MARTLSDLLSELDFNELHRVFLDNNYYHVLFPFLLVFAVTYTVLSYVKVFQNKDGKINKPIIFTISLIFSITGIWFETSRGFVIGDLLIMMFPNISAITIGILTFYIVGAIFGFNIFKGFYRKDVSAYLYFTIGAFAIGAVVFYLGIAMGAWNFHPLDANSYWNVVLGVAFLILGITLLFIGFIPMGLLILIVLGNYIANYGQQAILGYFVDPIVFIVLIIVLMMSWMTGTDDKKKERDMAQIKRDIAVEKYKESYGGRLPEEYESRIYDIIDQVNQDAEKRRKKEGN